MIEAIILLTLTPVKSEFSCIRYNTLIRSLTTVDAQQQVLAFHTRQIGSEYQWIVTWLEELQATT
jgi:hypothetical protein